MGLKVPVPPIVGEPNVNSNSESNAEDQSKADEKIIPSEPMGHTNSGIDSEENKKARKSRKDSIDDEERRPSGYGIHIVRRRPLRDDAEGWEGHHAERC